MGIGWWELTFRGVPDLTDNDLENIANKIKEGFREGQIIQEDDPPNMDEVVYCSNCGDKIEEGDSLKDKDGEPCCSERCKRASNACSRRR